MNGACIIHKIWRERERDLKVKHNAEEGHSVSTSEHAELTLDQDRDIAFCLCNISALALKTLRAQRQHWLNTRAATCTISRILVEIIIFSLQVAHHTIKATINNLICSKLTFQTKQSSHFQIALLCSQLGNYCDSF